VDAWHTLFASKKECVNLMNNEIGNTTSQFMCQIVAPH
jgi:hypothetical protein